MKNEPKKEGANKSSTPPVPLKPSKPDTKGAPNNNDPEAQYEDKDES